MAQISCHVLDGSWDDSKSSKTQVGKSVIGGILNLAEIPDSSVVDSCNTVVLNILRLFAFKPGQFRGHCTLVACAGNKYLCVAVWIMIKNKCPLRRGPFLASSTMSRIIYSALLFVKHFCILYLCMCLCLCLCMCLCFYMCMYLCSCLHRAQCPALYILMSSLSGPIEGQLDISYIFVKIYSYFINVKSYQHTQPIDAVNVT